MLHADDQFRYLPTSDRDRQWGLYVVGTGAERIRPGEPYPRPSHPSTHFFAWQRGRILHEYQVVYTADGEGEFESDAVGRRSVKAGSVMLLFPEVWHRYRPKRSVGWESYWVGFCGEDAERLCERGFFSPEEPILDVGVSSEILAPFETIMARIQAEPVGFQQLIAADVMSLLATILSASRSLRTSNQTAELVRRVKQEMEKHADGVPVVETLAAEFSVSPSHLHHTFKEVTGLSPYQYHLQVKIHRAKAMLRGTGSSIKDVARELSFHSVYHFSKVFKKKTGLSPRQWRDAVKIRDPERRKQAARRADAPPSTKKTSG